MAPGNWNDSTDRKLLLTIIHLTDAPRPDWNTVAGMMGENFTKEAVRQHFQKLQKENKAQFGDAGATNGEGGDDASPSKAKKKTPVKKATPKKRKAADAEVDDTEESPSKKAAPAPKEVVENEEDEE